MKNPVTAFPVLTSFPMGEVKAPLLTNEGSFLEHLFSKVELKAGKNNLTLNNKNMTAIS